MATVTETGNKYVCMVPFLMRKISATGGTGAASITHGESRSPDACWVVATDGAGPTQTGIGVDYTTSATVLTVDCIVDIAETFDIFCIWVNAHDQDGQTINSDNNT
jgi:hypothetical protein